MNNDYYKHLSKNGGMCACGDHLGVYVGTDINATPLGWAFIHLNETDPEIVKNTIQEVKRGRSVWPEKEVVEQVSKTKNRSKK